MHVLILALRTKIIKTKFAYELIAINRKILRKKEAKEEA